MPLANSAYTDATLGDGDFPRRVVHLGTNLDQFRPDAQTSIRRADLGIPEQAPLLGLFARLLPEKGQSILIEALAEADPTIHVMICGGPLESEYARAMIARAGELSLTGRIHWLGPKADIVPYYALADVVLNTRVDPEPFGMSIIESMAMQRPVLAHRAGGPQETIIDGTTGWLVDAPTKQAFAAGLARMMADRYRWPEMGRAARAHVETHFSEGAMLDRLENAMGLSASTKP
nr:glycosyltransferase family 4 protein [Mesorhizobium sp. BR1-1-16]